MINWCSGSIEGNENKIYEHRDCPHEKVKIKNDLTSPGRQFTMAHLITDY